jgi:FAD/FMN-containing dehydrogenase
MGGSLDIAARLGARLHGTATGPGDPGFDAACAIDNRSRQTRPAVVARCSTAEDVSEAVRFAGAEGLPLAVRSGGHSAAGHGSVEDGVVIDMRAINHVRVDATRRVAAIGGGALAGHVDRATHVQGLATTTPTVSTVGVAGFTLSGGISYLTRRHGLAIDNVVGADVVLADGSLVHAGEDGDSDLLWGIAGGGGNFGVVVELQMRLHPVSVVVGGPMLFPFERVERLVRLYRDWMPQQPEDIYAFLALLTVPPGDPFPEELRGRPACALVWCNTAPDDRSMAALATFRAEKPAFDRVGRLPYPQLQSFFDVGAAAGKYGHLAGLLFEDVPDSAVPVYRHFGDSQPTALCQSHLYPLDGAAARPPGGATAWPWRDAAFAQMFAAVAPVPGHEPHLEAWSTGFRDALLPYAMSGRYANFQMDEGPDAALSCYGHNLDRLVDLKGRYDPSNLFRCNQNIVPRARTECADPVRRELRASASGQRGIDR